MYLNNSIFGEVGVGVGCNMGLLLPVMDFTGMLHPLVVPFLPGVGGGGTSLHGLYGDVPLDRVWFSKIFKMSAKPQQQTNECRVSCRPGSVQLNL